MMSTEKKVRKSLRKAIDAADLNLTQNDEEKLEDQLIELLGYYNRAPEGEKEEVYKRGEERILQNFRPPQREMARARH
jgi:hypothetical protein